jgi:cytochrome c peroxidase
MRVTWGMLSQFAGRERGWSRAGILALLRHACLGAGVVACAAERPVAPVNEPPTSPAVETPAGVRAALTITFDSVPRYASPTFPAHYRLALRAQTNAPVDNPVTDRGALLGRVLFYDTQLSRTNTRSCASCHAQGSGFSDTARFSVGIDGVTRTRAHSMRLANSRYFTSGRAFWDQRAPSLEAQALQPIHDAVEMGFDDANGGLPALMARLRGLQYYRELFAFAFGDSVVSAQRISHALAQFVRSIVSVNSRFDQGFASAWNPLLPDSGLNAPFPAFSDIENRGKSLFQRRINQGGAGCAECHLPPTFVFDLDSEGNGLDAGESRHFKAPSLRNVALDGAFMHDGRFASLEAVVEHYNRGMQAGPALDSRLRNIDGSPIRLGLNASDKAAIVAYLRTLTDEALAIDPRFADPFRR